MACSNTFKVFHKNYEYEVPCGFCLNCRVDRRNFLEDCCKHSENKYGTSAFVCLTYDDYHLPISNGEMTLKRDDFTKFIKRLRRYLEYHNINNKFLRSDFSYMAVGEYGDQFNRPHYHVLFFGLDSRFVEKILLKTWKGGIVDCGPLDNGGIRYVLSYLEKNQRGSLAKALFDDKGLERPFSVHSQNLCSNFVLDKLDEIKLNHGCYFFGHPTKIRPISKYFLDKLSLKPAIDLYQVKNQFSSYNKKFSLKKYNSFRKNLAKLRQEKLIIATRNRGYPVPDNLYSSKFSPYTFVERAKIKNYIQKKIFGDVVPF